MKLKLNVELDQEGRALSLDQFTRIFLAAVEKMVRQELERWQVARPVPVERPAAPPRTKASPCRFESGSRKDSRREPQNHQLQHHS